jgi:hypothetical protein
LYQYPLPNPWRDPAQFFSEDAKRLWFKRLLDRFAVLKIENPVSAIAMADRKNLGDRCSFGHQLTKYELQGVEKFVILDKTVLAFHQMAIFVFFWSDIHPYS